MNILIIGGGGHARVVADILLSMEDMEPLGYVTPDACPGTLGPLGLAVLGDDTCVAGLDHDGVVVAVGDNRLRHRIFARLVGAGETLVNAVHPSAIIARDVEMGVGCMVCAGAIVNTGTIVGDNVILNTGCVVDHDCTISGHAHVAPGVKLAGNVVVGAGALVGVGASVIPSVLIGEEAVVGAGAVVVDDVPPRQMVMGVPARPKT
ncbi:MULTISPECIES: acetyltransferase [unclassified Pseudodesulfovibrio]|uniref:acetyltransferase n=1 Tax=unclassified Pseudodesulfovibrio TaxID=2661612 RepID=UPI000FEBA5E8|nr:MULTISPECIES: acetyltransferase [unclassified Pseudodesulfovibrio]MCJ2165734.1 acetyltransferase [Pseudodesulfovibrio sp. S3-i]RWU02895.1 transferase [Pseudodesulfovibrio sp. S3]